MIGFLEVIFQKSTAFFYNRSNQKKQFLQLVEMVQPHIIFHVN